MPKICVDSRKQEDVLRRCYSIFPYLFYNRSALDLDSQTLTASSQYPKPPFLILIIPSQIQNHRAAGWKGSLDSIRSRRT